MSFNRRGKLWLVAACLTALSLLAMARTAIADDPPFEMSEYYMAGANGGRAGLPGVKLWFKKSQSGLFVHQAPSWSYPKSLKPEHMHYSSWRFWQFGVSDSLLQMFSELATNPEGKPQNLGRCFSHLPDSGITCWCEQPSTAKGLVLDLTSEIPVNESIRSDHYSTYGVSNQLFISGDARFSITVTSKRQVSVQLVSSSLPGEATENLRSSLTGLSGHPLWEFPDHCRAPDKFSFVVEFTSTRKPGMLKPAA